MFLSANRFVRNVQTLLLLAGLVPCAGDLRSGSLSFGPSQVGASYGRLPLAFEPNQGQTDSRVKFLCRGGGYTLFLCPDEAVVVLRRSSGAAFKRFGAAPGAGTGPALGGLFQNPAAGAMQAALGPLQVPEPDRILRMKLENGNPAASASGLEPLPGTSNYFIGRDSGRWIRGVPHYAKAEFSGAYRGVDLDYYGGRGSLEYDFTVKPGADPGALRWDLEGADALALDPQGNLVLTLGDRSVTLMAPVCYQEEGGGRRSVRGRYVLSGGKVAFELGPHDRGKTLVIDPVLAYSTYLGGNGSDFASRVYADAAGNAYVCGGTSSTTFPVLNALQPNLAPTENAFLSKLDPSGNALVYSTYLGGANADWSNDLAVDGGGNVYLIGCTTSTDFPLVNPYQAALAGQQNAFVCKLDPSGGALVYSTYLGGSGVEFGDGVAPDGLGDAYLCGQTSSSNLPVLGAFQPALAGQANAFVSKLNPNGNGLLFSTYLGGSGNDGAFKIAYWGTNAFVTGQTTSPNFPVVNAPQPNLGAAGAVNAFVTKVNTAGNALVYSTYLGGSSAILEDNNGSGIAVDIAGEAYVTGGTTAANFPVVNALQATLAGAQNAFVSKFNVNGTALLYSTYLGGNGNDCGIGIDVDAGGDAYVTGDTSSTNFPLANPLQAGLAGQQNAFVSELNPAGSALSFSTYLGGSASDLGQGIYTDGSGGIYVTGDTGSPNFPLVKPFQADLAGTQNAFVAKIVIPDSPTPSPTRTGTFTASPTRTDSPTPSVSPTITDTFTASPTCTDSPTASDSPTVTNTFTDSPTATESYTASPTSSVTKTYTDTPTGTVTPTITDTPTRTPSFTASPSPVFAVSTLGKAEWGVVPVAVGTPLTLYFDQAPASSSAQVFNAEGEQVAAANFPGPAASLQTGGFAPGVYIVRTVVQYDNGSSRTFFQNIVVIR